ncbi:hypothetical protein CR513_35007, partial [Mucuna pruriens]
MEILPRFYYHNEKNKICSSHDIPRIQAESRLKLKYQTIPIEIEVVPARRVPIHVDSDSSSRLRPQMPSCPIYPDSSQQQDQLRFNKFSTTANINFESNIVVNTSHELDLIENNDRSRIACRFQTRIAISTRFRNTKHHRSDNSSNNRFRHRIIHLRWKSR